LCQFARQANLRLDDLPVRAIFATAEVLYDHQKQAISEAFGGVPVVNGYGSREGGFISHECPAGNMHIMSTSILVEFLHEGKPVQEGQDGEIVVTHLANHAMPFIRYRTGDIGQPSKAKCPCGRGFEVMKVLKGRSTDFVVTPDGRWVHGLGLIYAIREIPGVAQYQIVQTDVHEVQVSLVLLDSFPSDGHERIREGIVKRLGLGVRITVKAVDAIAQDASGKFRCVISEVARQRKALL
jgi:phenylacetate-CoA ligase